MFPQQGNGNAPSQRREFTPGEERQEPRPPIDVSMDLGLMVYDVFDLHDEQVRKVTKPKISLYHAVMEHGVIRVPDYDSEDVLKGGTAAC